jgi:alpha-galactosidase
MTKITIIGGGSSTFTPQLMRLFIESEVLSGATVTLMDIDERRLRVMENLSRHLVKREKADLRIEATTDQRESLVDADFVITAIAVRGTDAWEVDIELPAKYGVYMPIGDSVGPGGIMRAFRHIPVLVGVGRDLEEVSPGAVVFNYTNPVTANTMAMRKYTEIETYGLCSCSSIPRNAKYLGDLLGVDGDGLSLPAPAGANSKV